MKRTAVAVALGAGLFASPALAQQTNDDWDLTVQPGAFLTAATLNFGANLVAVRCRGKTLDVLVSGVPAAGSTNRPVRLSVGGIDDEQQIWRSTPGGAVISPPNPERVARQLRSGGTLDLRVGEVAADGQFPATPPRRYSLPIPPSAAAIDRVLSACDRPLQNPRDAVPAADAIAWTLAPSPAFPTKAQRAGVEQGLVRLSCLVGDGGRLEACEVVAASPPGMGFEEAALAATGAAALDLEAAPQDRGSAVEFYNAFRRR